MAVEICIIYDKVRFEEKALYDKALEKGLKAQIVDGKNVTVGTESKKSDLALGDVILQRSVSHYRGLYLTACLEFLDYPVINKFQTAETCGNKLVTSLVLAKNNIPTPKTQMAFSAESAIEVIRKTGLPLVLKPIVGSWGRGVFPLRDDETASMIVEMREENDSPLARIYYVQEMIDRPPRDIRCIVVGDRVVTAIYRYSAENEWRTNVARGGKAELAPITKELEDLALRAAKAVGGGIVGVDLMEDKNRGLVVHEVNNTVEFRGAASVSANDIPGAMIDYAVSLVRK
ncbi:lysine biosynthesis protein LysX [Nitrososphaera viennensis]|uniref:Lysine biosynthesis enzyme n=2 Tax=Nitrososphaera viennensis TaxID=1034015 RepID=A0A060HKA9_9ARCH|nr:lysine biosynthesis protein LysX [Nitrososphaera viennensis]AIC15903.1 lysine biosynthesis enzyme [Nitrososphaera viennensis EN76]UVS67890.1 lysine biosynthesis protein LysX [Nitrososphaera viennensis]